MLKNVLILSLCLISLSLAFSSCESQKAQEAEPRKLGLDVQWVRQSVEYQAICTQVYRLAWQAVKKNTANLTEDWVVVLDVDETTLDNSRYQEIIFEENKKFPDYWDEWVLRKECPPIPGVKAFIDSVRTLGKHAHVAYITNRNAPLTDATRENLISTGLWQDGDILLCQKDRSDTKEIRRQEVINGTGRCEGLGQKKIVALIGDQISDMETYPTDLKGDAFKNHYLTSDKWGQKYFMLPNPMYGYWTRQYQR